LNAMDAQDGAEGCLAFQDLFPSGGRETLEMDDDGAELHRPRAVVQRQNDLARKVVSVEPAREHAEVDPLAMKRFQRRCHVTVVDEELPVRLRNLVAYHLTCRGKGGFLA